jgi:hypothetical protein
MNTKNKIHFGISILHPIAQGLAAIEIHSPQVARLLCKLIPASCPFERDIRVLGHTLFHIPPLCKLNPFYEQIVELRFKALSYLADRCGEDTLTYI